jgi:hypothetical protein
MTTGRINQVATLHDTAPAPEGADKATCGAAPRKAPNRWESVPECASIQAPGQGRF